MLLSLFISLLRVEGLVRTPYLLPAHHCMVFLISSLIDLRWKAGFTNSHFFNEWTSQPGNSLAKIKYGRNRERTHKKLFCRAKQGRWLSKYKFLVTEQFLILALCCGFCGQNERIQKVRLTPGRWEEIDDTGAHSDPGTGVRFDSHEAIQAAIPHAGLRTWAVPDSITGQAYDLCPGIHLLLLVQGLPASLRLNLSPSLWFVFV